jgi:outer membrane protein
MKFKTSVLFFLLILSCIAFLDGNNGVAGENGVFTLEGSIAKALEDNVNLKAMKERIEQASYAKKQTATAFLPKLGSTYGYTRLGEPPMSNPIELGIITIPAGELSTRDNYQFKATATQPIFMGFALLSAYQLAKLGIHQSGLELDEEILNLALQVKEAYFNILKADKALEVAEKAVEALDAHVIVARSFYEVGMTPVNDLLKAEVELANAKHDLVKVRNDAALAMSAFNVVLSRHIHAPVKVEDILISHTLKVQFEESAGVALKNRPEMRLLDVNIHQAEKQIMMERSGYYPQVSVTFDYIREGDEPEVSGSRFHDSSTWQAMALCSWTFWEWGKTHYSVKEYKSLKRELLQTKKALEDRIRLEVKEAVLDLEEAEKNIPTTEKAVEQAEENLRVSQERYKAQVTTSTEVLDAQTLLTEAKTYYYNALYDYHLARARLKRAMGVY